ncbi:MAG: glycosyltransferase [Bacteroidaceae bacterium]|nr:glycosyltransferase [Bacteroidaceae bacterium]
MKESLLSIIIPTHNIAEYIGECLQSVIIDNPALTELFKVIIVDDGSTDNTTGIIESTIAGHSNMVLYKNEHQGVSAARNFGIQKCDTKYLTFLDGDDTLLQDGFVKVLTLLQKEKDLPELLFMESVCNGQTWCGWKSDAISNNRKTDIHSIIKNGIERIIVLSTIYQTDFIVRNNIDFPYGITISEDLVFSLKCLLAASWCIFYDIRLYKHTEREGSIVHTSSIAHIGSLIGTLDCYDAMKENFKQSDNTVKSFIDLYKYDTIMGIMQRMSQLNVSLKDFRKYNINKYLPVRIGAIEIPCSKKFKAYFLNYFPGLFYLWKKFCFK